MRKFQRLPEPEFLAEKWETWGREWAERLTQNRGASFNWRQVDREPVNHKLLVPLKTQTDDHCSFCDNYPISPPSIDTIEHFRPKAEYPLEAYSWTNLYYCCAFCQRKNGVFQETALRPDADDYQFDRYFRWDHTLGTIEVNEQASAEDRDRAAFTIRFFRLNEKHPTRRKEWLWMRARMQDKPLNEFPYRDYLDG